MNKFSRQFFYILLALPLGIFYFVAIVIGLCLSLALFVVWLGIPVFIGVSGFAAVFAKYERALANNFLGANIAPLSDAKTAQGIWATFKARFSDDRTWLRSFYLLGKLPVGILFFTLEISVLAASLFLLATPFLYQQSWYRYVGAGYWHIATMNQSLAASCGGLFLLVAFFDITNALSRISAELARSALAE